MEYQRTERQKERAKVIKIDREKMIKEGRDKEDSKIKLIMKGKEKEKQLGVKV